MGRNEGGAGTRTAASLFRRRPTIDNTPYGLLIQQPLGAIEESIRNSPIEHGVLMSLRGDVILRKSGTEDEIVFDESEVLQFKDNVFTHNHPSLFGVDGGTFSMEDVQMAMEKDLRELRAVSQGYTFILRRPTTGWPLPRGILAQLDILLDALAGDLEARYQSNINSSDDTVSTRAQQDFIRDYSAGAHTIMSDMAAANGIQYERRRR